MINGIKYRWTAHHHDVGIYITPRFNKAEAHIALKCLTRLASEPGAKLTANIETNLAMPEAAT